MKINKTIFDLNTLCSTMSHSVVWQMCRIYRNAKFELLAIKEKVIESTFAFGQNVDEIAYIDEQIAYVDGNIKTLEDALLCFETKIFEKRNICSSIQTIGLN